MSDSIEDLLSNSANNDPVLECRLGTKAMFSRADLEALVGQVVHHMMASQKAGPSPSPAEAGECLRDVSLHSPPTQACFE